MASKRQQMLANNRSSISYMSLDYAIFRLNSAASESDAPESSQLQEFNDMFATGSGVNGIFSATNRRCTYAACAAKQWKSATIKLAEGSIRESLGFAIGRSKQQVGAKKHKDASERRKISVAARPQRRSIAPVAEGSVNCRTFPVIPNKNVVVSGESTIDGQITDQFMPDDGKDDQELFRSELKCLFFDFLSLCFDWLVACIMFATFVMVQ